MGQKFEPMDVSVCVWWGEGCVHVCVLMRVCVHMLIAVARILIVLNNKNPESDIRG